MPRPRAKRHGRFAFLNPILALVAGVEERRAFLCSDDGQFFRQAIGMKDLASPFAELAPLSAGVFEGLRVAHATAQASTLGLGLQAGGLRVAHSASSSRSPLFASSLRIRLSLEESFVAWVAGATMYARAVAAVQSLSFAARACPTAGRLSEF